MSALKNRVVVGIDSSQSSVAAVEWASDEARLREAPLGLLHAWFGETTGAPPGRGTRVTKDAGAALLDAARERVLLRHPGLVVSTELADGHAREALVSAAGDAALLVVGARGSGGFPWLLLGSTGLYAAAHASCPVVVVHATGAGTGGGVVAGLQGRGQDDAILAYAFDSAQRRSLALRVVHSSSYPLVVGSGHELPVVYDEGHIAAEHERLLAELLAGWRERFPGVAVTAVSVRSSAARELVTGSEEQQLVVVGRHGVHRGPLGRLGSTSQAVVRHAACPVAVVPV